MQNEDYKFLYKRELTNLHEEIEKYESEEKLWVVEKNIANSGGNLTQHLIGNLRTYIGLEIGKIHYVRNRPAEFNEKVFSKAQLLTEIEKLIIDFEVIFDNISTEKLNEQYPKEILDFKENQTYSFILTHLLWHLGYHAGQINYHRRLVSTPFIFHITTKNWWKNFENKDFYESPTLLEEKFIHLSTANQVEGVLERYYAGQTDLLKLHVNPEKLKAELKYELATNQEFFPHLFGKLNKSAIENVEEL